MLRTQFKMELIVYSQDGTYSQSLKHAKDKLEEIENDKPQFKTKKMNFVSVDNSTGTHATLREMRLHLESYYTVSLQLKLSQPLEEAQIKIYMWDAVLSILPDCK